MKPFYIRDIKIDPPLILSPMAGVTDYTFRSLIKRRGGVFRFIFIAIVGLSSYLSVDACSCLPTAPCQSFGGADVVFTGRVVGSKQRKTVVDYETVNEGRTNEKTVKKAITYDVGEVYFQVLDGYLGAKKGSRITIYSNTGGGDCGQWFRRGETYVIFAQKEGVPKNPDDSFQKYTLGSQRLSANADRLWTSICSGNRTLADARETISYLNNLPKPGDGGEIVGTVYESIQDYSNENFSAKRMSGMRVRASSMESPASEYFGTSDVKGNFTIKVPAGNYRLQPVIPSNLSFNPESEDEEKAEPISVQDQQCKIRTVRIVNNSEFSGKVVNKSGELMSGITVDLVPMGKDPKGASFDSKWASVWEGQFSFKGVPTGRYQLSLNYDDTPDDDSPYPTTFYPLTLDRSKATIFDIKPGTKIADLLFQLPEKLAKRAIAGAVVWRDGKAAVGAEVQLVDIESGHPSKSVKADANGAFQMSWFEGRKYKIKVVVWQMSPDGQSGFGVADAETKEFILDENTGKFRIVLAKLNPNERSITRTTRRAN